MGSPPVSKRVTDDGCAAYDCEEHTRSPDSQPDRIEPNHRARGAIVETSMGAGITGYGLKQVVRAVGTRRFRRHLTGITLAREDPIAQSWQEHSSNDCLQRRSADPKFSRCIARCPNDFAGDRLRLIDWRHRLETLRQTVARPVELRCVDGRQLHHSQAYATAVVLQLAAQRVCKAANCKLGSAIG